MPLYRSSFSGCLRFKPFMDREECMMDRIDKILNHKLFLYHLKENEAAETDRRFCRHNMSHFLDVARIGALINAEEGLGMDREWIYAAALLHDLGRHLQYENGIPHAEASALIAPEILNECGFDNKTTSVIISAISTHGKKKEAEAEPLGALLYRADKASRACFYCGAEAECDWSDGKKNLRIKY